VIYADSNFSGDSRSLPIGNYRLNDFNDVASSIKVPPGLGAIIYEHADEGGGYGISVHYYTLRPYILKERYHE
jgi:hypothetical protein